MRIISGTARGRRLAEFSGTDIRPTPDRVREAIFSVLFSRLGTFFGLQVLELFAGSGAMSLEAVSRGAKKATIVDLSHQAIGLIEDNMARCKFPLTQIQLLKMDALAALPRVSQNGPYDLIFLDPPYGKNLLPKVLREIDNLSLLSGTGIVCAESSSEEVLEYEGSLEIIESRRYGSTAVHLLQWEQAPEA